MPTESHNIFNKKYIKQMLNSQQKMRNTADNRKGSTIGIVAVPEKKTKAKEKKQFNYNVMGMERWLSG